jgi:hypothetical protein
MAKEKTQSMAQNMRSYRKRRARTSKGTFIPDDKSTPDVNEAYIKEEIKKVSKSKVPLNHIKQATEKAKKPKQDLFLISWLKKLFGVKL